MFYVIPIVYEALTVAHTAAVAQLDRALTLQAEGVGVRITAVTDLSRKYS